MLITKKVFRVQMKGAFPVRGVMVVAEDDRTVKHRNFRIDIEFDNGTYRSYHYPYPVSVFSEGNDVLFKLPNGEIHHYDLMREIEVTPGTKQIKVLSTSMIAPSRVEPRG